MVNDTINMIKDEWMLITAGTKEDFNTMTANWGGFGWLWNKRVAFVFIRPERYTHNFTEQSERMTLSFYKEEYRRALQICGTKSGRDIDKVKETGLTPLELESGAMTFKEARLTFDCRKLFQADMTEANFLDKDVLDLWYKGNAHGGGYHTVYVVEIENVIEE